MLRSLKSIGIIEVALIQFIIYCLVWFAYDYLALVLSVVMVCILTAVVVISLIAELIEPSKVPRSFFKYMIVSAIIPVIVGVFFITVLGITPF